MAMAIRCHRYGALDDLSYDDVETPAPAPDQVMIRTEAIGVNFPDGLLVKGLYQMKPETPFVPGMEAAGTIAAVGSAVTDLAIGDRVVALLQTGGYAQEVVTQRNSVVKLPDSMDGGEACALLCAYGTAQHALKQRAALRAGEKLVVLGAAGSTGLAAIQIGKAMGAHVVAVASNDEKRALAEANGADAAIGYDDLKDAIKRETGGGADVVFDPVGGDAFDAASRAMARGGRLLAVGFASGRIPQLPVNLALVKEYSLVGVFCGNFTAREPETFAANMRELFTWHGEGKIRPHIEGRYPLADAASVLERVLNRGALGKLVLVPQGPPSPVT